MSTMKWATVVCFVFVIGLHFAMTFDPLLKSGLNGGATDKCFCQLEGKIDDCLCNVDTVDYFNNMKIYPRLQSLLKKDFFRYFSYNAAKPCPFWDSQKDKCKSSGCGVKPCTPDEIPFGLKPENCRDQAEHDHDIDATISESVLNDLKSWRDYDDSLSQFCELDPDDNCPDCQYVDLNLNPERFTGYAGEPSHRVWRAIYEENCFNPASSTKLRKSAKKNHFSAAFLPDTLEGMCLEKRAFYRAISGLHSSITVHLTAQHPNGISDTKSNSLFPGMPNSQVYGPNLQLFLERFDPDKTEGMGPYWLKNLYFVYLLELRALTKAAPFLETQTFYTGNEQEDKETLIAVKEVLNLMKAFPDQFDETSMFKSGNEQEMLVLKEQFREHFRNISRVMDCVTCDKCKLWGKLQITGLGTALKILFSNEDRPPNPFSIGEQSDAMRMQLESRDSSVPVSLKPLNLKLSRNEIVALFNAFGRISTSIQQLERFRRMMS